jgi:hypothetical protein
MTKDNHEYCVVAVGPIAHKIHMRNCEHGFVGIICLLAWFIRRLDYHSKFVHGVQTLNEL